MANLNKIFLMGNVGKPPELFYVNGTKAMAKFSLATNTLTQQKDVQWHNIIVWNELAERVIKHVQKGSLVFVEGKLDYRVWEDQQGNEQRDVVVVANNIYII